MAGLRTLAADVRAIVGAGDEDLLCRGLERVFRAPARRTARGDVFFHLDPLWADDEIDFVGIDLYHPLTDWRDDAGHLDEASGRSPYDRAYLRGEHPRRRGLRLVLCERRPIATAQVRTPITDGAAGKPWVFRFKDIERWWSNAHYDRPGGVRERQRRPPGCRRASRSGSPSSAARRSTRAPTSRTSSSIRNRRRAALPYFSSGARDDLRSARYLDAFSALLGSESERNNPISPVYGGPMVDPAHLHLWAWDARPYPAFPDARDVWSDGANWERGHWLNGRLGVGLARGLVARSLHAARGLAEAQVDTAALADGPRLSDRRARERPRIDRAAGAVFCFDAVESEGLIRFVPRGGAR